VKLVVKTFVCRTRWVNLEVKVEIVSAIMGERIRTFCAVLWLHGRRGLTG
jgi:hypothetical protein